MPMTRPYRTDSMIVFNLLQQAYDTNMRVLPHVTHV